MSKSVYDEIQEQKEKYGTKFNTYEMFPTGTKVQVITVGQDFYFFRGTETGVVTKNTKKYLGIIVKFDEPRHFEGGHIQYDFGFNPDDLIVLKKGYDELADEYANSRIAALEAENARLKDDLKVNAGLLAKQCDRAMDLEAENASLRKTIEIQKGDREVVEAENEMIKKGHGQ